MQICTTTDTIEKLLKILNDGKKTGNIATFIAISSCSEMKWR